jgi:FMN-dependent NADH-azoreductase
MKLLRIDSSARGNSVTRKLTAEFSETWKKENPGGQVVERDLSKTLLPLITDDWVEGSSRDRAQRTPANQEAIGASDALIAELAGADTIVIGAPMYNFSIPFVITSRAGSYVPGSPMEKADFQEPYLRFILGFVGINDVTFIHAEHQGREAGSASLAAARERIEESARQASQV